MNPQAYTAATFILLMLASAILHSSANHSRPEPDNWETIQITPKDTFEQAILIAIHDFLKSSSLRKKDDVFSVRTNNLWEDIIGVSVFGRENKLFPAPINKIGSSSSNFPTRYIEEKNKLFYWYDSTYTVTLDLISILAKYDHIDSMNVNEMVATPEIRIDDAKKGMDYYFCKNNLTKYKKVKTSVAMGWYEPPTLKCHE